MVSMVMDVDHTLLYTEKKLAYNKVWSMVRSECMQSIFNSIIQLNSIQFNSIQSWDLRTIKSIVLILNLPQERFEEVQDENDEDLISN